MAMGTVERILKEVAVAMKGDSLVSGFVLEPKTDQTMHIWTLRIFQFDLDSQLARDLTALCLDHVELELTFPDAYPFEPPFVRVVSPRLEPNTGCVSNGALCMELLTPHGWSPAFDIEALIVSIRALMTAHGARVRDVADLEKRRDVRGAKGGLGRWECRDGIWEEIVEDDAGGPEDASREATVQNHQGRESLLSWYSPEEDTSINGCRLDSKGGFYTAEEAEEAFAFFWDYCQEYGWGEHDPS